MKPILFQPVWSAWYRRPKPPFLGEAYVHQWAIEGCGWMDEAYIVSTEIFFVIKETIQRDWNYTLMNKSWFDCAMCATQTPCYILREMVIRSGPNFIHLLRLIYYYIIYLLFCSVSGLVFCGSRTNQFHSTIHINYRSNSYCKVVKYLKLHATHTRQSPKLVISIVYTFKYGVLSDFV